MQADSAADLATNSPSRPHPWHPDPLDRILPPQAQATAGPVCWGQSFGSGTSADDALGNLLSASVTKCSAPSLSVSVNGNTNQISSVGFGYDAAGDMTADGQFTYTYDAENRITSSNAGVSYTGVYPERSRRDGNGLRVKKSSGALYWRAFSGDVLAETDTSGNTTKEYIYFGGRQIAWRDSAGNVYYEFADMLGSVRSVTNSTGSTCGVYPEPVTAGRRNADYYPGVYPERSRGRQEVDHTSTCPPTYKFAGYEYDSETGNYYAFFRYYSPRLGRFMTADPLGGSVASPQSLNRYSYVLNNPSSSIDPLGLSNWIGYAAAAKGFGGGGGGGGGWVLAPAFYYGAYVGVVTDDPFLSVFGDEFQLLFPTGGCDHEGCGTVFNESAFGLLIGLVWNYIGGGPQGPAGPTQPQSQTSTCTVSNGRTTAPAPGQAPGPGAFGFVPPAGSVAIDPWALGLFPGPQTNDLLAPYASQITFSFSPTPNLPPGFPTTFTLGSIVGPASVRAGGSKFNGFYDFDIFGLPSYSAALTATNPRVSVTVTFPSSLPINCGGPLGDAILPPPGQS